MTNFELSVECVLVGNIKQVIAKNSKGGQPGGGRDQHNPITYNIKKKVKTSL